MWKVPVSVLLVGVSAALAGCAGGPKAAAPPGVMLAGDWKLNHAASDDPQKVIAKMHAQAWKILARAGAVDESPRARGRGTAGGVQSPEANPVFGPDDAGASGGHGAPRPDVLQHSPMMQALAALLARGDYLTVRQSGEQFLLDYGSIVRSYTPGAHSVVSAGMGVADQVSGWDGREYVIEIKAQLGPNVVEKYGLSSDGRQLIEKLRIGPAELPAVDLKRVYDRTSETAPRAPPTTG